MQNNRRRNFLILFWLVALAAFIALLRVSITFAMDQRNMAVINGTPNHWELVFNDEFDTDQVDPNKWTTCYYWANQGCANDSTNELGWYQPANVTTGEGAAHLTAQNQPAQGTNGKSYAHTSGMISTGRDTADTLVPTRFSFQYGFVEVRARFNAGQGLNPVIWLAPSNQTAQTRIDVMNVLGGQPDTAHMNVNVSSADGSVTASPGEWKSPASLAGDWHTYAVDWRPDSITWYIDGVEQRRFEEKDRVPVEPMYLLASLTVGGDAAGAPDASTSFPATLDIDFVRIYKQTGNYNFQTLADTYVDSVKPAQNFGQERSLAADGDPQRIIYLKFNLESLRGSDVKAAWLRVRTTGDGTSGSGNSTAVYIVSSNWDEKTLTFQNRPEVLSFIVGLLPAAEPNITYDIPLDTAEIQKYAGKPISLALVIKGGDGVYIYSREFRPFYPQLMITTNENAPILTPTPYAR